MSERFEPSPLAPRLSAEEQARDRDLGFGAVVGRESRERLLNRDGSFNVARIGLGLLEALAPYQQLLTMAWPRFLGMVAALYFVLNLMFAVAYVACGRGALAGSDGVVFGGSFSQAFFFSVQTFATIGYGQIVPMGMPANIVVTIEALVGLMFQALATGLLFARFARPTASIVFSRRAVVAPYGNGRALMFRIANRRRNEIIQLDAQVLFSWLAPGERGAVRRYELLSLERNRVTFFPLSWTIVHPLDENSPLTGKTEEELRRQQAEILVLLSGTEETFEQTVHARSSYRADEIVWNARFQSMFVKADAQSHVSVDISRIHDIEPV
jgi:inward rectifier potassium channel